MLSFFRRQSPRRDDLLRNNRFVFPPSSEDGLGADLLDHFCYAAFRVERRADSQLIVFLPTLAGCQPAGKEQSYIWDI